MDLPALYIIVMHGNHLYYHIREIYIFYFQGFAFLQNYGLAWTWTRYYYTRTNLSRAIQSQTESFKVKQNHTVIQNQTEPYRAIQSHTKAKRVIQSNRVTQSHTETYRDKQSHKESNRVMQIQAYRVI